MARKRVLVLFGGAANYTTSLRSAADVLSTLSAEKYETIPVGIDKRGRWYYFPGDAREIAANTWAQNPDCSPAVLSPDPAHHGIVILQDSNCSYKRADVIFSLLSGRNAAVGGLCELSRIPCVGNGVMGSAICENRALSRALLGAAGIPTPPWMALSSKEINRPEKIIERVEEQFDYPLLVTPAETDSAAASTYAGSRAKLSSLIKRAFARDSTVLVEPYARSREMRVGVFGYDMAFSSFVGEIEDGRAIIPAPFDDTFCKPVRDLAMRAFTALGCRELALFHFIDYEGEVVITSVESAPDLSEHSVYSELMADLGMRYPYLLEKLIEQAIEHSDSFSS